MNKKAYVEVQFNWIFVLVAGAIILIFFAGIVIKQKKSSDERIGNIVLTNLEAILYGVNVGSGVVKQFAVPNKDIEFYCDYSTCVYGSCDSGFRIEDSGKNIPMRVQTIFSPSLLKEGNLVAWSSSWDVAFKVTNFLFLTSPEVRYVIVGSDDLASQIFKELPAEIKKEAVTVNELSELEDTNNYNIRFIFIVDELTNAVLPSFTGKMKDKSVSALKITGGLNKGQLQFYRKSGNNVVSEGNAVSYLGSASLFAGIFADSLDSYKCGMEKAFKRLNMVAQVYQARSAALSRGADVCSTLHGNAVLYLGSIIDNSNIEAVSAIDRAVINLISQNQQARLNSCASIY